MTKHLTDLQRLFPGEHPVAGLALDLAGRARPLQDQVVDDVGPRPPPLRGAPVQGRKGGGGGAGLATHLGRRRGLR